MKPAHTLKRHAFPVNAMAWAPHSGVHLATAGMLYIVVVAVFVSVYVDFAPPFSLLQGRI